MRIAELITRLDELRIKHGNLVVVVDGVDNDRENIDNVVLRGNNSAPYAAITVSE